MPPLRSLLRSRRTCRSDALGVSVMRSVRISSNGRFRRSMFAASRVNRTRSVLDGFDWKLRSFFSTRITSRPTRSRAARTSSSE